MNKASVRKGPATPYMRFVVQEVVPVHVLMQDGTTLVRAGFEAVATTEDGPATIYVPIEVEGSVNVGDVVMVGE